MADTIISSTEQYANQTFNIPKPAKAGLSNLPSADYVPPRISPEEIGQRGEALYAPLRTEAEANHYGKFLSIDVETGEQAIGDTSQQAYNQILSRRPDAMLYMLRVGYRATGKI